MSSDTLTLDILSITVLEPVYFLSKTSFKTVDDDTVISEKMPRQIAIDKKELIESLED